MTSPDLSGLIERGEAAGEGDQYDVLVAAFEAIKGPIRDTTSHPGFTRWHDDWFVFERKLKAFAFLDAAMTLVPEGWRVSRLEEDWFKGRWIAQLAERPTQGQRDAYADGLTIGWNTADAETDAAALSIVAASLRAQKEQANG